MHDRTPAQQFVTDHGGPAALHRALVAMGLDISIKTVKSWSSPGRCHREPHGWLLRLIEMALAHRDSTKG